MHLMDTALPIRPGEHACCRLAHTPDRERLARAFVRAGLERGDKVLYSSDREDLDELRARLTGDDETLAAALDTGRLSVRRAADVYTPDGRFDARRMLDSVRDEHAEALAAGYRGLSMTGEMGWAAGDGPGCDQLTAYEQALAGDDCQGTLVFLCQYDHGRFGAGVLSEIAASHDVDVSPELAAIGRDGCLAAARVGPTLRLTGELDFACADGLAGVLGTHFHGPLRLDLDDVAFIDVAGMRALRGRTGQSVTIVAASPAVRRLLALLAWDTDPAIELLAPA
jgi:ABC-type transporter Mla MlaB component